MTASDDPSASPPPPDLAAGDPYDVDALLVELGGDEGRDEGERAVCQSIEDLYSADSRFLMVEMLGDFLDDRRLTATELLHTVEPQRQFLDWSGRAGALERTARVQARPGRWSPAMRLEELKRLEQEAGKATLSHAHRGAPPTLDAGSFAGAVARVFRNGQSFASRFAIDALLSAWLADAGTHEGKLTRVLSLVSDALAPRGVDILDQVIGELLASPAAVGELFGWVEGLRASIEALAQVWKGEAVTHPRAPNVIRRLCAFIGAHGAAGARRGLEATIHRALLGDDRLAPIAGDPRAASAVMDEVLATGALANKLRVHGRLIGGEATMRVLDHRIARLLTEDRLETVLQGKSHYARLVDLLTFEGAILGERGRRMVVAALQRHLDGRDFTQRLFEGARTPRARIKALADIQGRILRSGLPDAARDKYARMLDEIQHTYLRANRILARIAKDRTPTVDEVWEFARLCAERAFTEPKSAGAVRELVGHHARATSFLRGYLARRKEDTERRGERFAEFFGTLAEAGTPLRDMSTLRVLLADDEPAARSYVAMILRDLGIVDIAIAEDGRAALACFDGHETDFDLIICDWKMPRMSGLEFLKHVRAARPEMPFLMVTALATMIAVEEAMAHDVTAYIAKPFSPEHLEEKILILVNR